MYTDKLYTGQRDTGLGIYHYRARFYSPYINHFISADTVIPSYTNPQDLNRYSYVNNNPLRYTDPTGHMRVEEAGSKKGCSDSKYCQNGKPKQPKQNPKGNRDGNRRNDIRQEDDTRSSASNIVVRPPDAGFISFSYTAGSLAWYQTWSVDILLTNDEIGVFRSEGIGPGFGSSEIPWSIDQRKMDKSLTSPTVGGTVYGGVIWGKSLQASVQNYQGPSRSIGTTAKGVSFEYFESVNRETGVADGSLRGFGIGFGESRPTTFVGEVHNLYVDLGLCLAVGNSL